MFIFIQQALIPVKSDRNDIPAFDARASNKEAKVDNHLMPNSKRLIARLFSVTPPPPTTKFFWKINANFITNRQT